MAIREELKQSILTVTKKVDMAKMQRLNALIGELKSFDELLGHNAETARDQLRQKAEPLLAELPNPVRVVISDLLTRATADSIEVALRMLEYNLPSKALLFMHLDDFLDHDALLPTLHPGIAAKVQGFIEHTKDAHLVILSHDSADVTAVLMAALVGKAAIDDSRVSMVYESGMGVYLGGKVKQKHDYLSSMRTDVLGVIERMAVVSATLINDTGFKSKYYFSATEYSIGIRVHPYARGNSTTIDKEAAHELIKALAAALSDLVKEDIKAVESHIINYFLTKNPDLAKLFSPSNDERVWDMEKIDELLDLFQFVHLGARGSLIRPTDATDVQAAQTIFDVYGAQSIIIASSDTNASVALFEWVLSQSGGFVACSEAASKPVLALVETRGGMVYTPGHIEEVLGIIDAYSSLRPVIK